MKNLKSLDFKYHKLNPKLAIARNRPREIKDEPNKQPFRAPILGDHTQQILNEIGFSKDKITNLKERGVIEY